MKPILKASFFEDELKRMWRVERVELQTVKNNLFKTKRKSTSYWYGECQDGLSFREGNKKTILDRIEANCKLLKTKSNDKS